MSNGEPKKHHVSIDVVDNNDGWAFFSSGAKRTPVGMLPAFLSDTLIEWMKNNPRRMVRNTLGIVSGGETVGLHVWYAERAG